MKTIKIIVGTILGLIALFLIYYAAPIIPHKMPIYLAETCYVGVGGAEEKCPAPKIVGEKTEWITLSYWYTLKTSPWIID